MGLGPGLSTSAPLPATVAESQSGHSGLQGQVVPAAGQCHRPGHLQRAGAAAQFGRHPHPPRAHPAGRGCGIYGAHRCAAAQPSMPGPLPPSLTPAISPDSPAEPGCTRRKWGSRARCEVGPGWAGQTPRPEQKKPWLELGRQAGWQSVGTKVGGAPTSMLRITWPRRMAASLSRWSSWYSQAWRSGGRARRAESVGHSIVKGLWDASRSRGRRPATWQGGRGVQSQPSQTGGRRWGLGHRDPGSLPPATLPCSHPRQLREHTRDEPAHTPTAVRYVGTEPAHLCAHAGQPTHTNMA